jgi:hypothetical protein
MTNISKYSDKCPSANNRNPLRTAGIFYAACIRHFLQTFFILLFMDILKYYFEIQILELKNTLILAILVATCVFHQVFAMTNISP